MKTQIRSSAAMADFDISSDFVEFDILETEQYPNPDYDPETEGSVAMLERDKVVETMTFKPNSGSITGETKAKFRKRVKAGIAARKAPVAAVAAVAPKRADQTITASSL